MADESEWLPPMGEWKTIFREWKDDYAARREEDRRVREGMSPCGPRETWPSEIAKANRHKQSEQDHGNSNGQEQSHDDGHSM